MVRARRAGAFEVPGRARQRRLLRRRAGEHAGVEQQRVQAVAQVVDEAAHFGVVDDHRAAGVGYERKGVQAFEQCGDVAQLLQYGWPGNVRELKNVVQRAFILADTDVLRPDLDLLRNSRPVAETASTITFAVGTSLAEIERRMLFKTLAFFDNNKARTAEALGVTTKTIYNRLAHYQAQARAREGDDGDQDPNP